MIKLVVSYNNIDAQIDCGSLEIAKTLMSQSINELKQEIENSNTIFISEMTLNENQAFIQLSNNDTYIYYIVEK